MDIKNAVPCHKPHLQGTSYKMTIAREEREMSYWIIQWTVNCVVGQHCAGLGVDWLYWHMVGTQSMPEIHLFLMTLLGDRFCYLYFTYAKTRSQRAHVSVCRLCSYWSGEARLKLGLIFPLKIWPRGFQSPLSTLCTKRGRKSNKWTWQLGLRRCYKTRKNRQG